MNKEKEQTNKRDNLNVVFDLSENINKMHNEIPEIWKDEVYDFISSSLLNKLLDAQSMLGKLNEWTKSDYEIKIIKRSNTD